MEIYETGPRNMCVADGETFGIGLLGIFYGEVEAFRHESKNVPFVPNLKLKKIIGLRLGAAWRQF